MVPPSDRVELPSLSLPHISGDSASSRSKPIAVHLPGYAAFEYLGRGAMGELWSATQLSTKRTVAVKIMHDSIVSLRATQRFEREIELTAALDHPNIARVYDSGNHDGLYFYAMELIKGVHLDQYVRKHKLNVTEQLRLILKICRAMQHAHGRGIIHRDLKPSNILVRENGEPCVLDFGLGFALGISPDITRLSRDGEVIGTLAYMSPEQARGDHAQTDARSDIYSIGVMAYDLLLGVNPHDLSGGVAAVSRRIAEEEVKPARQLSRLIDRDLNRLVMKTLEIDPNDRYPTAAMLASDIERYLEGEPLQFQPATVIYFLSKRLRKYRGRITVAALIIAVLVIVTVLSVIRVVAERDRANIASALAIKNEQIAVENAAEARARLAQLYVSRGMERVDADDPAAALPWLLEALRIEADNPTLAEQHRTRLAMVRNMVPDLADMRFLPHRLQQMAYRNNALIAMSGDTLYEVPSQRGPLKPLQENIISLSRDSRMALVHLANKLYVLQSLDEAGATRVLQGLTAVDASAFTPDGTGLITIGDQQATRWDTATGQQQASWKLAGKVVGLRFSPDGNELVTLVVNEQNNGKPEAQLFDTRTGEPTSVAIPAFALRGALLLGENRIAVIRKSMINGQSHFTVQDHDRQGNPLGEPTTIRAIVEQLSPAHPTIFYTDDTSIRAMDLDTRVVRIIDRADKTAKIRLSVDAAGQVLMGAWEGGSARVWDIPTGRALTPPLPHDSLVTGWVVDPAAGTLITCTTDAVLRTWRYAVEPAPTIAHGQRVIHAALSPDGRYMLACGTLDARLWRVSDGTPVTEPLLPGYASIRGAFSDDGTMIATGHGDGTARLWRVDDGSLVRTFDVDRSRSSPSNLRFTADGSQLLVRSSGKLTSWDTRTGSLRFTLDAGHISLMSLSPDSTLLATAVAGENDKPIITLWDADTGKKRGEFASPAWLNLIAFTNDSDHFATFDPKGNAQAYRTSDLKPVPADNLRFAPATATAATAISGPDGKKSNMAVDHGTLIVGTVDGTNIISFDGAAHITHTLLESVMPAVALQTAKGIAATVDSNGVARVWSIQTGEPISPRLSQNNRHGYVGFPADGRQVVLSENTSEITTLHPLPIDERSLDDITRDHRLLLGVELIDGGKTIRVPVDALRADWRP